MTGEEQLTGEPGKRRLRIIFMGTPEFAVASLEALVQSGHTIAGVITAPDKPAGRGMKMGSSAVKNYAVEKGLTVLQPEKLRDPAFLQTLQALQADLQVVVAFRMLPEVVWDMPPLGTINVHASLLPKYRGAAPINWAIINGEKETGVTTFRLTHAIDTGHILLQRSVPIGETETAGELHDKLKELGAELLVETLEAIAQNRITGQPQETLGEEALISRTHAPRIFTDTCRIDWTKSTAEVYNLIRGLSPFPCAFTLLHDRIFKIYRAEKHPANGPHTPGTPDTDGKTYLRFACRDGYIHCTDVQAEGKKRMEIGAFLRGFRL